LTIQTNGMAAVVVEQVAYHTDAASMRAEAA
jgi:hypothetical protein